MTSLRASGMLSHRDRSHLTANGSSEPAWYTNSQKTSPANSERASPFAGQPRGQRYADDLEGQNDEALAGLTAKVKVLKDISLGIGQEVRESAVQLSQMNDAFAETGGILSGTFRRMNTMAQRQGGRWACYMIFLILVFWIFVLAWLFR